MKRSRFCLFVTIAIFILLYLPIVLLMVNSFNESRFGGLWTGFSLKWYARLLEDKQMWIALKNSLIVAFSSTIASTFLGTCAAFALHFYRTPLQKAHYFLVYTPLIIPDILMGISLLLLFFALNIKLGLLTITIAHTTFCVSYVAMVMLTKLQHFDFSLVEVAQDLGASRWTVIRRILLPLLAPAILAGALLAFTLSIDDFVITFFMAGEGTVTLPLYIYSKVKFGSTPTINALSTLLLIVTFATIWLVQIFSKEESL
ncbi:MAG: ABC transporter permease [Parachlamydiaceae bacterium]|nr:ABC transporter permease [Parachlamydiaceae bacterium]